MDKAFIKSHSRAPHRYLTALPPPLDQPLRTTEAALWNVQSKVPDLVRFIDSMQDGQEGIRGDSEHRTIDGRQGSASQIVCEPNGNMLTT